MACGPISAALLILLGSVLLVDAASLDLDITKELEEVITKDNFVLSIRNIKPKKRSRGAIETLFSVDFPGAENKFSLLLDRKTKRVIVETLEDSRNREQHFTVDILQDHSIIRSLILAVNQTEPGAHANLYIDCISYGMVATPKSMKDMYLSMRSPKIEVFHERKYAMDIDGHRDLRAVLGRNECPLSIEKNYDDNFTKDLISNSLRDDPNIQSQEPYFDSSNIRRGDIPLVTTLDDVGIINAINELIKVVNLEVRKCERQGEAFERLLRLIEECELCRRRPPSLEVPTCATNPPSCASGVRCQDTSDGPRCGPCPAGYIGNGYECHPGRTCADRPCYPGVECRDNNDGYRCGPCPGGYEGDGEQCRRRNPCEYNPCAPGCVPVWPRKARI